MSEKLLLDEAGKKAILLGNEAIVRGALESGIQFASTYPGTPASEIGDTFSRLANSVGVYFEYSTNEKVAFEAAAGASLSGLRSLVSFKQFGLNVASDSIFPIAYVGVEGGMLIVFADDPSGWSSAQSEQDSRCYAKLGNIPMLEPSDSQECLDFVKIAFELSEKFKTPVFIRLTTRVSHTRGIVSLGKIVKGQRKANFVKDPEKYNSLPPKIIKMHEDINKKIEKIKETFEESKINKVLNGGSKEKIGVITSGVSFNYVLDAMNDLGLELPVLKLGTTYPLPEKKIKSFLKNLKSVMIVEELEPALEKEVEALAKDVNPGLKILGKIDRGGRGGIGNGKYFPIAGEYTTDIVLKALSKALGKKMDFDYDGHMKRYAELKIPQRFPVLCPGCPHRATFYAVKKAAGNDAVFIGDIGCYLLGVYPPFETEDLIISMGAGEGIGHGIKKAEMRTGGSQKLIIFIGDSTFFHAGIPALINMVYNKSNPIVVVLDNRITAMTGHQPHPGVGVTGMGEPSEEIKIEDIVRACGVKNLKVVDPYNFKEMENTVKEFLNNSTVSVIVAKRRCYLLEYRDRRRKGVETQTFEVVRKIEESEKHRLKEYACPAFYEDDKGNLQIDESMCWGCASCVQLWPAGSLKPREKKK